MFQSSVSRWHFIFGFFILGGLTAAFGLFIFSLVDSGNPAELEKPPLPERAVEVLDFWFGTTESRMALDPARVALWESPNATQKNMIRQEFAADMIFAKNGTYDFWMFNPKGRLALLLLLDQFPDILYPDTPQQIKDDKAASEMAIEGIRLNQDIELTIYERLFFYHPLIEVEDLRLQNRAVALYERLHQVAPDQEKPYFKTWWDKAKEQRDILYEFGRFPEQNKILKREPTEKEKTYLNKESTMDEESAE